MKKGERTASGSGLQVCRRHVWDSSISVAPQCLLLHFSPACLAFMPFFFLPVARSHLHFYHGGNSPSSLLAVGGSGGGSCIARGVYYYMVSFYGCLIGPYWRSTKDTPKRVCASRKVCVLCHPSCRSRRLVMVIFVVWIHTVDSPTWYYGMVYKKQPAGHFANLVFEFYAFRV